MFAIVDFCISHKTGAVHLTGSTARISKGLCKLALSHCGITSKGVNQIAQSLTQNQSIANSLTHLDISGNSLKDDINVRDFLLNFYERF